jgi:hypothetical protein
MSLPALSSARADAPESLSCNLEARALQGEGVANTPGCDSRSMRRRPAGSRARGTWPSRLLAMQFWSRDQGRQRGSTRITRATARHGEHRQSRRRDDNPDPPLHVARRSPSRPGDPGIAENGGRCSPTERRRRSFQIAGACSRGGASRCVADSSKRSRSRRAVAGPGGGVRVCRVLYVRSGGSVHG